MTKMVDCLFWPCNVRHLLLTSETLKHKEQRIRKYRRHLPALIKNHHSGHQIAEVWGMEGLPSSLTTVKAWTISRQLLHKGRKP